MLAHFSVCGLGWCPLSVSALAFFFYLFAQPAGKLGAVVMPDPYLVDVTDTAHVDLEKAHHRYLSNHLRDSILPSMDMLTHTVSVHCYQNIPTMMHSHLKILSAVRKLSSMSTAYAIFF